MADSAEHADELFLRAVRESMEANQQMLDALDRLDADPELRGPVSRGDVEGLARRIQTSNERLKDFARTTAIDIPPEDRPSNWDDVLTMKD